ncbi:MAG: DUF4177 domain-containing protein [Chloroflexi bacterium]|nr:DUF4177 domain-containing protein [Chloroflexota bacterium]
MQRWQYTWAYLDVATGLIGDPAAPSRETVNERGLRGWELVSVVSNGEVGERRTYIAFFKRLAED